MSHFTSQAHAEHWLLWYRYHYYVRGCALISDSEYDVLCASIRARWSICLCGIGGSVGSNNASDYPHYIVWGIRPGMQERLTRDAIIANRWLDNL